MSWSTITQPCARPGCTRLARPCVFAKSGHARYCETCRTRARAHGDPAQGPIRKPDVKKVVRRIRRLLKRGNFERVETYLRERAALLREAVESPEAIEVPTATPHRPRPRVTGWKVHAVSEMLKVLDDSDPIESGLLVAALFLMRIERPNLFASDSGFNYELSRMWRAQTRMAFGSYYDQKRDRTLFAYRVLPARVTEYIAEFVSTCYSRFAGHVISAVEKERIRKAEHEATLAEGFETLLK